MESIPLTSPLTPFNPIKPSVIEPQVEKEPSTPRKVILCGSAKGAMLRERPDFDSFGEMKIGDAKQAFKIGSVIFKGETIPVYEDSQCPVDFLELVSIEDHAPSQVLFSTLL